MGCGPFICGKETYHYIKEQKLLNKLMSEFSHLSHSYSHDFVINCHKHMLLNPTAFLLKYQKKIEAKQIVPHTILEKWKLILYATNTDHQHYADSIGFDQHFQEERIASRTYRFSKRNPLEIRLQDLYFHQSYRQIEKDAGRVYLVPQIKQDSFQKLLKKIANHFPQSGYSLGINYIIGYFLLVGMSEIDSFWMFVHLTLNQKFLGLGFFENDLPLTKVIIEIFKNLLRRKNKDLYQYIYVQLEVDDASWILKWFTSFFLSTFPIQFCHYVLDFIFSFGVLGLAIVAYGIVNFFQTQIYRCQQASDFFICLQQLFSFEYFSQQLLIQQFMSSVYDVVLHQRDFDLLGQIGDNFYVKYFVLYSEWNFKYSTQAREKMNELLSGWYLLNKMKRETFTNKMAKSFDGKFYNGNGNGNNQNGNKQGDRIKEDGIKEDGIKEDNKEDDLKEEFDNQQTNIKQSPRVNYIKDEKLQPKTHENIQISPHDIIENKNQDKISQKPISALQQQQQQPSISGAQKPKTIKISSKHIKFSVKSSDFYDETYSEKQAFKQEWKTKRDAINHKAKSQKALSFKKQLIKKIRSQRRLGYIGNNYKEKQGSKKIRSFKSVGLQDFKQEDVEFNKNPLSKDFSIRDKMSKTMPLRKNSDQIMSLRLVQNQREQKNIKIKDQTKKSINENQEIEKKQKIPQIVYIEQRPLKSIQSIEEKKTPNQSELQDEWLRKIWSEDEQQIKVYEGVLELTEKENQKQKEIIKTQTKMEENNKQKDYRNPVVNQEQSQRRQNLIEEIQKFLQKSEQQKQNQGLHQNLPCEQPFTPEQLPPYHNQIQSTKKKIDQQIPQQTIHYNIPSIQETDLNIKVDEFPSQSNSIISQAKISEQPS